MTKSTRNSTSAKLRRRLIGARRMRQWSQAGMIVSLAATAIWFGLFLGERTLSSAAWTIGMAVLARLCALLSGAFNHYMHRLTCKCPGCNAWRTRMGLSK